VSDRDFAILINTTDRFEDCWVPFFSLFKKYWPDYKGDIYLNTERKSFSFIGLNIVSLQNNLNSSEYSVSWSECLNRSLNFIKKDIILYMQEDYFLTGFVKEDKINELAELMSRTEIDCIHLTDQATPGPFHTSSYNNLLEIDKNAPYRISTQAALWKRNVMKQYIRKNESAWQFEQFGTKRAYKIKHNILNVDTGIYVKGTNEIIPYVFTGIIKGKWNKEVVDLFEKNGLRIDFSSRGFYELENKNRSDSLLSVCKRLVYRVCRS
jgi:hypothetical protein